MHKTGLGNIEIYFGIEAAIALCESVVHAFKNAGR